MTQSERVAEVKFLLCKSIFVTLAAQGIVAQEDVQRLLGAVAEKYYAPIGELEVNSMAGEKNYKGCCLSSS